MHFHTVDSKMFVRSYFLLIFANWLPRKFQILTNKESLRLYRIQELTNNLLSHTKISEFTVFYTGFVTAIF